MGYDETDVGAEPLPSLPMGQPRRLDTKLSGRGPIHPPTPHTQTHT